MSQFGVKTAEYASFLDDVDEFDNKLFGLSSGEVSVMDPQQRLALEVAYECLAQSSIVGENPDRLGGKWHLSLSLLLLLPSLLSPLAYPLSYPLFAYPYSLSSFF